MVKSSGVDAGLLLELEVTSRATKPSDPVSHPMAGHHQRCLKRTCGSSWDPWLNSASNCCKRNRSVRRLSANALSVSLGFRRFRALVVVALSVLSARLDQALPLHPLQEVVVIVAVDTTPTLPVCRLDMLAAMATAMTKQVGG